MNNKYSEIFGRLTFDTATVLFIKKDGTIRCMLATRNMSTVAIEFGRLNGLLDGHDKRCNIHNGNISVMDLDLGEPRSFNVDRLVTIGWYGEIDSLEKLEQVKKKHHEFEEKYNAARPREVTMEDLV